LDTREELMCPLHEIGVRVYHPRRDNFHSCLGDLRQWRRVVTLVLVVLLFLLLAMAVWMQGIIDFMKRSRFHLDFEVTIVEDRSPFPCSWLPSVSVP
jgi:hypothetical protein